MTIRSLMRVAPLFLAMALAGCGHGTTVVVGGVVESGGDDGDDDGSDDEGDDGSTDTGDDGSDSSDDGSDSSGDDGSGYDDSSSYDDGGSYDDGSSAKAPKDTPHAERARAR